MPLFIEKHQNIPQVGVGGHVPAVKAFRLPSDPRVVLSMEGEEAQDSALSNRASSLFLSLCLLYHRRGGPSATQAHLFQKMPEPEGLCCLVFSFYLKKIGLEMVCPV